MAEERVPVLETKCLGIQFGGLKAVNDVNIEIYPGELIGLIGPNGAGKTTIFNLITGIYKPTSGSYMLCGRRMNGLSTHQVVEAGIARTFQNIRLFKKMTVLENVMVAFNKDMKCNLFQSIFRTPFFWKEEAETAQKAMELLKLFKLDGFADQLAENLPYGKQRLLEIARALATDMKLLLLDEPAAGMNPVETAELKESIKMLREKFRIPILLIEHDNVNKVGAVLAKKLDEFKEKYNCVGDVRHIGLFSCVEFVKDKKTKEPIVPYGQDPYGKLPKIIGSLRAKGFLTFGHENMVLCNPPLIITEEQLLEELDKLEEVIQEVEADPFYMK